MKGGKKSISARDIRAWRNNQAEVIPRAQKTYRARDYNYTEPCCDPSIGRTGTSQELSWFEGRKDTIDNGVSKRQNRSDSEIAQKCSTYWENPTAIRATNA